MALIKKGGSSRLDPARLRPEQPDDSTKNIGAPQRPEDATRTISGGPQPDDSTRSIAARQADDSTRGIGGQANDSTRSIAARQADDSTRGIGGQANDSTRGIGGAPEDATHGIGAMNQAIPRQGTEAIRAAAPAPAGTSMAAPGGMAAPRRESPSQAATIPKGTLLESRYMIEDVIGIGGMSVVYRARDQRFKDVARFCAIKEMYQSSPDSSTRLLSFKNFEREAGLLATLNHNAIPKVYDFFEDSGKAYLAMELITGVDLETLLEDHAQGVDELRVGRWALQLCDVLTYLHGHTPEPIIFRDLKPSNIILTEGERIVLVDFGIARVFTRLDKKGTMIGTEGYSPPEQYRGVAEARGDVYALGATLHHLLTGSDPRLETPFTFQDRPIRQFSNAVSPEMEAVVMKALEYDMTKRWNSAEEFRQALLSVPGLAPNEAVGSAPRPSILNLSKGAGRTDVLWAFRCEDEVRSSPVVRNGMLYVGCYDTNLYALDVKRGEFRWKKPTEGGLSSSPAVWSDIVVVGSEDHNIYAFDTRTGASRWTFRTENAVRSSPRVIDRLIYVGSDDQHLYAIDGSNGRQIWRHRAWQWIRSSACITPTMVVIGSGDGAVYGLDAFKGGLKWKQKLQGGVVSSGALADKVIIIGAMDNNLYALDADAGWPVWKFRTNHYVNSSPAVLGNRVFVGGIDGNVYAIDVKNGRQVWKYEAGAQIISSPALDSGKVYIGSADGVVHCIEAGSGQAVWLHSCEGPIVSSPSVVDGIVYIGSMDHHVYALKA